ncbi:hypothetical protein PSTT_05835, partial [Puccinia striiformis]
SKKPTVVPAVIPDLVSFLVLRRFNSPTCTKNLIEAAVVSPTAQSITSITRLSKPLAPAFLIICTCKRLTFNGGSSFGVCEC